jgi:hypothetical protein
MATTTVHNVANAERSGIFNFPTDVDPLYSKNNKKELMIIVKRDTMRARMVLQ